jgi:hypothetical protein
LYIYLLGIYNGARGKVVGFAFCHDPEENHWDDNYQKELPIVFVQMDNDIGISVFSNLPNVIPFSAVCDSNDKFLNDYVRYQIPLRAAFAITTHKMQGSTVKANCVTCPSLKCPWSRGLDYVANSRVTELSKLFILRPFSVHNFVSHKQERDAISDEYTRLAKNFCTI